MVGLLGFWASLRALILLIYAGSLASDWLTSRFVPHLTPSTEPLVHRMIMPAVIVYMVCMMLPFVPGMEIGLALMVVFGPRIVPLVYGATGLALSLSFLLGRLVPQPAIISALESLQLNRVARLLAELQSLIARTVCRGFCAMHPAALPRCFSSSGILRWYCCLTCPEMPFSVEVSIGSQN